METCIFISISPAAMLMKTKEADGCKHFQTVLKQTRTLHHTQNCLFGNFSSNIHVAVSSLCGLATNIIENVLYLIATFKRAQLVSPVSPAVFLVSEQLPFPSPLAPLLCSYLALVGQIPKFPLINEYWGCFIPINPRLSTLRQLISH